METLNELMNKTRLEFEQADWLFIDGYRAKVFEDEIFWLHRYIAEKALGKKLPAGAEVHHYNGNRYDNRSFNLVICPSKEYHELLHERAKKVFGTENSYETYRAIKKASWEHQHRYSKLKRRGYKTVTQLKAKTMLNELESKSWWAFR